MKHSACIAVGLMLWASFANAQGVQITAFERNGRIDWTNNDTNLYYRVEWAPSLMGDNPWQDGYGSLVDIRTASPTGTAFVPMFYRIVGSTNRTYVAAPVPRTMFTKDSNYDDGYHSRGVDWPVPRFTVGTGVSSQCVIDNLTGLMWLRNPDSTQRGWWAAMNHCDALDGNDGRGGYTDWRMPNIREMVSLIDYRYHSPALANTKGDGGWVSGDPFLGIQTTHYYWSGTSRSYPDSNGAWGVLMTSGDTLGLNKFTGSFYVWPVRGGQ